MVGIMIPTQFPFNLSVWLLQKAFRSQSMTVSYHKFNQMALLGPAMVLEVENNFTGATQHSSWDRWLWPSKCFLSHPFHKQNQSHPVCTTKRYIFTVLTQTCVSSLGLCHCSLEGPRLFSQPSKYHPGLLHWWHYANYVWLAGNIKHPIDLNKIYPCQKIGDKSC